MMEWLITIYKRFHHLVLYGIIGSFSAALDFSIYTLLVKIVGVPYIIANCCSVLIGISCSFFLNRNYNFKVKDRVKSRFTIFLIVGLCGLTLSNIILCFSIETMAIDKVISKVLSIVSVVLFQFVANKKLSFKPSEK